METFGFQPAEVPGVFSWLFACVPASIKKRECLGGRQEKERTESQLGPV